MKLALKAALRFKIRDLVRHVLFKSNVGSRFFIPLGCACCMLFEKDDEMVN